jgi:predicted ATPase
VAEALGIEGAGTRGIDALATSAAQRRVLLVLDNCEHLLDVSAALVDALLDHAPGVRVLATSREPLRVDGEVEQRLGSLGGSSARLFAARARAAVGGTAPLDDNPAVAELCERLDGLPLAIELAAAQLRHLPLPQLLARLDDRLTLLVGGRPKAGVRHSALAATIDWSYRLLAEPSRQLLDRLGVFPASFDLAAAAAVAEQAPVSVTAPLGDLVAKSLVTFEPSRGRYRLLESARLYAAQRLDQSGATDHAVELVRQHVVRRTRLRSRVDAWLSALLAAASRDDIDNVRLAFHASISGGHHTDAVDIAIGLSTLWRNTVSYADGGQWVETLGACDLEPRDRLWTEILTADVGLGASAPTVMRTAAHNATVAARQVAEPGAACIAAIYSAITHLADPARTVARLDAAAAAASAAGEDKLERLARGFRMVARTLHSGPQGLRAESEALTQGDGERDYSLYLARWAGSVVALADRDSRRLARLMSDQLDDLAITTLHGNWLTMYWEALTDAATCRPYVEQVRRARDRALAEGRDSTADCVLVLAVAAAYAGDWDRAAELVGAVEDQLLHDTASFIHLGVVRDRLVRPHLEPAAMERCLAAGRRLSAHDLLTWRECCPEQDGISRQADADPARDERAGLPMHTPAAGARVTPTRGPSSLDRAVPPLTTHASTVGHPVPTGGPGGGPPAPSRPSGPSVGGSATGGGRPGW